MTEQAVQRYQARVHKDWPQNLVVAFGGGMYVKGEWRNVPPELEHEMGSHAEAEKKGEVLTLLEYKDLAKPKKKVEPAADNKGKKKGKK